MKPKVIRSCRIGFYFITDSRLSRAGNSKDVSSALKAGVKIVQYREKIFNTKQMYNEALRLRRLCKNTIFIINDRLDIALSVNADGVHLGQDDLPYNIARKLLGKNKIIGVTVHNQKQAREAQKSGADYIAVSPIFKTATKSDAGSPKGVGLIREIKRHLKIPIVAIGGINLSNARKVILSGADGLCSISAVVTKPDLKREIEKFGKLYKQTLKLHCLKLKS